MRVVRPKFSPAKVANCLAPDSMISLGRFSCLLITQTYLQGRSAFSAGEETHTSRARRVS